MGSRTRRLSLTTPGTGQNQFGSSNTDFRAGGQPAQKSGFVLAYEEAMRQRRAVAATMSATAENVRRVRFGEGDQPRPIVPTISRSHSVQGARHPSRPSEAPTSTSGRPPTPRYGQAQPGASANGFSNAQLYQASSEDHRRPKPTGVVTSPTATLEGFTVVRRLGPVAASADFVREQNPASATAAYSPAMERACAEAMEVLCYQVVRGGGNAVLNKKRQVRQVGTSNGHQKVVVSGTAAVVSARADAHD